MAFAACHTSRDYESEMQEIRTAILAMGDSCQSALATALEAFRGGSADLAASVRELDRRIDANEMAIDALVVHVIALRQPVASDLRFLAMTLKLVTDLERIGDEAVNIAERAADERCEPDATTRDVLERMSIEARKMVSAALEAFASEDERRAHEVLLHDDVVDDLHDQAIAGMEEYMRRHPSEIRAALAVVSVAKYLERVADHATNIAEEVIFVVRGEDVRHYRSTSPPLLSHPTHLARH
jgi:phosphate transport system protein